MGESERLPIRHLDCKKRQNTLLTWRPKQLLTHIPVQYYILRAKEQFTSITLSTISKLARKELFAVVKKKCQIRCKQTRRTDLAFDYHNCC